MAVGVASDLMRVIVGGHPDAPGAAEGITATLEPLEALFPVFRSESEDIAGAIPPERRLPASARGPRARSLAAATLFPK